jgi:hypothetical protein
VEERWNCWIAAEGQIRLLAPGSRRSGQLYPIGGVSMESVQGPYPYGLMLPQSETERLLEERLGSLGVIVEQPVGTHRIPAQLRRL